MKRFGTVVLSLTFAWIGLSGCAHSGPNRTIAAAPGGEVNNSGVTSQPTLAPSVDIESRKLLQFQGLFEPSAEDFDEGLKNPTIHKMYQFLKDAALEGLKKDPNFKLHVKEQINTPAKTAAAGGIAFMVALGTSKVAQGVVVALAGYAKVYETGVFVCLSSGPALFVCGVGVGLAVGGSYLAANGAAYLGERSVKTPSNDEMLELEANRQALRALRMMQQIVYKRAKQAQAH